MDFMQGDVINDAAFSEKMQKKAGSLKQYDILVANILAEIIIPLTAKAGAYLKPDGIFISSGILQTKEEAVRTALTEAGFEILETTVLKDWVCFTARKKP